MTTTPRKARAVQSLRKQNGRGEVDERGPVIYRPLEQWTPDEGQGRARAADPGHASPLPGSGLGALSSGKRPKEPRG